VCGGEGDVSGGVPVLGEDDVAEFFGESVDDGDDLVAFGNGERASDAVRGGTEVVLDVDDEEGVGGLEAHDGLMVVQGALTAVEPRTIPTLGAMKLRRRWGTPVTGARYSAMLTSFAGCYGG